MRFFAPLSLLLMALVVATAFAPVFSSDAHAWRQVRTGQKSFERGYDAYVSRQLDTARRHFVKSADAFQAAMATKPMPRTMRFEAALTQAGFSFYMAGRYEDSLNAMKLAAASNKRIWEARIFSAMAHARLGDDQSALAAIGAYFDTAPSQSILSQAAERQAELLERGEAHLPGVAQALENGLHRQLLRNTRFHQRPSAFKDRCNGAFWWRYNDRPCRESQVYDTR